jgi:hypothetical protein
MAKSRKHRKVTKKVGEHNNDGVPSNYELTPDQVAQAIEAFQEAITTTETAFREHLDLLPSLTGRALAEATQRCAAMEDFLAAEKSQTITEIEHLYENSLANLMHHWCAVEPAFLAKIVNLVPDEPPPTPKILSLAEVEHHDAIVKITGEFLKTMA